MRKTNKILSQKVLSKYTSLSSIDLDRFFNLVGRNNQVIWVEVNNEIFLPAADLSLVLNKHRTDYAANYESKGKAAELVGRAIKFNKEEIKNVTKQLKQDFATFTRTSYKSWFLDWPRAYDYIFRTHKGNNKNLLLKGTIGAGSGVILHNDALFVDTKLISTIIGIDLEALNKIIEENREDMEEFGTLQMSESKETEAPAPYVLNEDQALYMATIAGSSKKGMIFKKWMVKQFSNARKVLSIKNKQEDYEHNIHRQLVELSLYTSLNVQSEYPLSYYDPEKGLESTKRVDILINKQIAIELKNVKITSSIVSEVIGRRGYYHSLRQLKGFKYLILSSPVGVTHDASKMLEALYPRVIYLHPQKIGDKIASLVINEYPKDSHWWVINFLLPKFTRVISNDFLSTLQS